MLVRNITIADHRVLLFVKERYESAFKHYERTTWLALLQVLDKGCCQLQLIEDQDMAGFIISWKIGDWLYLEHMAITPSKTGRGLGELVMKLLLKQSGNRLPLEVSSLEKSQKRNLVPSISDWD